MPPTVPCMHIVTPAGLAQVMDGWRFYLCNSQTEWLLSVVQFQVIILHKCNVGLVPECSFLVPPVIFVSLSVTPCFFLYHLHMFVALHFIPPPLSHCFFPVLSPIFSSSLPPILIGVNAFTHNSHQFAFQPPPQVSSHLIHKQFPPLSLVNLPPFN